MKLFEVADVVIADDDTEVGAKNERRICAINCNKTAGFEVVHGLLDRVMQLLEVPWSKENGYYLEATDGGFKNIFYHLIFILTDLFLKQIQHTSLDVVLTSC